MSDYVAGIWKCRYFWLSLVRCDLKTRYRRSVLGIGWSLLQPIAMTAVLCLVFHKLFNQSIADYGPSLMIGLCLWNFLTTVVLQGCHCLFQGEKYIRQYPAPMGIYPLRVTLGAAFHFLMALAVAIVLRWMFKGFDNLPALIHIVPTLLMLFILGWSLAVLTGFANTYFPDTQNLSEVALQILFYGTPIMYPAEVLRNKGMGWLIDYSPLAALVETLRQPILNGTHPSMQAYGVAIGTVTIFALAAIGTLKHLEKKIIFQL